MALSLPCPPPVGRILRIGGRALHLTEDGPRDGPAVVLLHGASGNLLDWRLSLLPALDPGLRVVAVDRPGFGHSDRPPGRGWRLRAQGEAIRAGLAALGIRRYLLVGHSWAGALALDWALRHPGEVAGAVVLSGATMDWGGALGLQYRLLAAPGIGPAAAALAPRIVGRARLEAALAEIFAPQPVPEGYAEAAGVGLALRPRTFRFNARALVDLHGQVVANAPRYREIACPVAVVHGAADRVVPAEIHARPLARALPGAALDLLDGVGHMPHHAAPGRVAAAVSRLAAAVPRR